MGGEEIGVEVPDVINAGDTLPVVAISKTGDTTLALRTVVRREDDTVVGAPLLLQNQGGGRYSVNIRNLGPGCYRITVETAVAQRPVDSVTDITLVWDQKAAKEDDIK
jgi:hypothetical protein